jgi:arylformamidase
MSEHRWIDISVPVYQGMVHWPGDPEFRSQRVQSLDRNDVCNVTEFSTSAHIGTHMDAPAHFLKGGIGIDQAPLDALIGECRVIEIQDPEAVGVAELERHEIAAGERFLFKTRNSDQRWHDREFAKDFVYISLEGAEFLAGRGVRIVGVDYLSVGGFAMDGPETHRALLSAGIWIIEGLDLSQVRPGRYELICLPLKLRGSDGAPARALVRPL